ncbi:rhomboid family protein [Thermolongibacillus altinsuensis]|uniref:Rhomboid family protein n=2 Tax=Thermolongibacillus altinsuensis TaxID=575256 RepID=A0A4R1QBF8_9BACL|nr:rhomboid family protein [Thermolongibacillus altinsuensis]
MMIITTFMGGYNINTVAQLGGYDKQLVHRGQIWRLLTYAFGHMSYAHFFLNMPFILIFSRPLERILGGIKFLLSYVYMSVFASIIIHFFSNYPIPLAGSSGPGYGLLGMYIFLVLRHRNKIPTYDRRFIITFTLMGFIMTFLIPGISISGHIGGFVGGILLSPFVFKKQKDLEFSIGG